MSWDLEVARHRELTAADYAVFRRTRRSDLRWVTVVHGAFVVRPGDDTAAQMRDAVAHLGAEWREVLMEGGRIRRDPRGYTRWTGVVELDLLHPRMLCSRMKNELLAGFGVDSESISIEERVVVLHTHMIIDGRGHRSWSDMDRDLRSRWSDGPRQVHFAKIHECGTVSENIDRLAGYSTKFRFAYSRGWLDRKTEYLKSEFEPEWREYLENAYRVIGLDKLAISSVRSRSKEGSRAYGRETSFEDKTPDSEVLQLTPSSESKYNYSKSYDQLQTMTYYENGSVVYSPIRYDSKVRYSVRIQDLIPYVDLEKITDETLADLCDAIERSGGITGTPERLEAQYGDELGDIAIQQARMELRRTRAEMAKLSAEATKLRAEATDDLADAGDAVLEALHLHGRPLAATGSRHTTRV